MAACAPPRGGLGGQHRDARASGTERRGEREKVEWEGWGTEKLQWGKLGGLQAADVCRSDGETWWTSHVSSCSSNFGTLHISGSPHSCLKPMYASLCVCVM